MIERRRSRRRRNCRRAMRFVRRVWLSGVPSASRASGKMRTPSRRIEPVSRSQSESTTAKPMEVVPRSSPKMRICPLRRLLLAEGEYIRKCVVKREAVAFRKQNDPLRGLGVPRSIPPVLRRPPVERRRGRSSFGLAKPRSRLGDRGPFRRPPRDQNIRKDGKFSSARFPIAGSAFGRD